MKHHSFMLPSPVTLSPYRIPASFRHFIDQCMIIHIDETENMIPRQNDQGAHGKRKKNDHREILYNLMRDGFAEKAQKEVVMVVSTR